MSTRSSKLNFFNFPTSKHWNDIPPDTSIPHMDSLKVDFQIYPSPCMFLKEYDVQFRCHGMLGVKFVNGFRDMLFCKSDSLEFHSQWVSSPSSHSSQVNPFIEFTYINHSFEFTCVQVDFNNVGLMSFARLQELAKEADEALLACMGLKDFLDVVCFRRVILVCQGRNRCVYSYSSGSSHIFGEFTCNPRTQSLCTVSTKGTRRLM